MSIGARHSCVAGIVCLTLSRCSHVILPQNVAARLPGSRLLSETEWRNLGVVQSHGWEHYMVHEPEPHILLFKREKDYLTKFGNRPRPTGLGEGAVAAV